MVGLIALLLATLVAISAQESHKLRRIPLRRTHDGSIPFEGKHFSARSHQVLNAHYKSLTERLRTSDQYFHFKTHVPSLPDSNPLLFELSTKTANKTSSIPETLSTMTDTNPGDTTLQGTLLLHPHHGLVRPDLASTLHTQHKSLARSACGLGVYQGVLVRDSSAPADANAEEVGYVAASVCGSHVSGVVLLGARVWSIDSDGSSEGGGQGGEHDSTEVAPAEVAVRVREVDTSQVTCGAHSLAGGTHAHVHGTSAGAASHHTDHTHTTAASATPTASLPFPLSALSARPSAAAATSHNAAAAASETPLVFEILLVSDRHRTEVFADNALLVRSALQAANVADMLYSRAPLDPRARVQVVGLRGLRAAGQPAGTETVGGFPLLEQGFEAQLGPEAVPTVDNAEKFLREGTCGRFGITHVKITRRGIPRSTISCTFLSDVSLLLF